MRFLSTIKARLGILPFSILPFVLPLRLAFLCLAFPLDGELLVLAIIFPLSFVLGLTFVLTLSFSCLLSPCPLPWARCHRLMS